MKKKYLIILLLITIKSFSQKVTDAHLKYTLTLNVGNSANNELLKTLYEDVKNKEDSLLVEKISKGLLEATKN